MYPPSLIVYTARFDISPFFDVIKSTIEIEFDYKKINWSEENKKGRLKNK